MADENVVMTDIQQFMQTMKAMPKGIEKQLSRFTVGLATRIRKQAILNTRKVFGKTRRENAQGEGLAGSRGSLAQSIQLGMVGRWPGVTVGSPTVPYAAIHEFGGPIKAKNVKFLTIPMHPFYQGKRAGEFNLRLVKTAKAAFLVDMDTGVFAYILKRRVNMPARPYLWPAAQSEIASEATRLDAEKILKGVISS